jgi:hypothetical protein
MMLTATIILVVTVGAFAGFCFYVVWREKKLEKNHYLSQVTLEYAGRFVVFQKRIFERSISFATGAILGVQSLLKKIFLFFFPSAKKAFEEKHLLTGLHHGPTSYFLGAFSADKKQEKEKKSRTRKKI